MSQDPDARPLVAVVDYRMGNLRSLATSLERAGAGVRIITGPEGLEGADGLLLPGVGAFGPAMANLAEQKLLDPVIAWARADLPFLAICVGMQLLFEESEEESRKESNEEGAHKGLGLVPGRVRRLPEGRKIPEMGWNTIELTRASRDSVYGASLADGGYYYFAHSYCVHAGDDSCVLATTIYGLEFASVVGRGRMLGTQFHPEKSAEAGLAILKRFVEVAREAR
ncbi:MAG: imidazole glycerol phosphate synthase subunit HisH [Planctomycetota bacterium]